MSTLVTTSDSSTILSRPTSSSHIPGRPTDLPVPEPETTSMSSPPPSSSETSVASVSDTRIDVGTTADTTSSRTTPRPSPTRTSTSRTADAIPTTTTSNAGRPPITSPRTTQKEAAAATTVSVISVSPSDTSTLFTTITSSAESTLSTPISVSVTDLNGSISLTVPPFVTLYSTSTGSDGAFITFTHLIANPAETGNLNSSSSTGFFNNNGQVAGVFTVVGVVSTALIVGSIWCIRRHRRRQRRKAWFASMRQDPPSPFARALNDTPVMQSTQTHSFLMPEPRTIDYNDNGYRPPSAGGLEGLGLTGLGAVSLVPERRPRSGGDPFRDPYDGMHEPILFNPGLMVNTNTFQRFGTPGRVSIAPSSPSIYPDELPDERPTEATVGIKIQPLAYPQPSVLQRSLSANHADAPPRPPRSHLRDSGNKATEYIPLTPPASTSSHSKPPSPEEDERDVWDFHRNNVPRQRTLLNARPHTAPNNSTSQTQGFF